ncbi:2949_t:CDS:1 [Scutellospora calospora]|uniref:2949_t:CDS:1 n=1 Tax=Scutellospora calospora TaxID=85575 RepID=A0ACA9KUM0_9GLOM|nr:2949_t:CDS:1 [Scutellospora calospora]
MFSLANANPGYSDCTNLPMPFGNAPRPYVGFDPDPVGNKGYITVNTHYNLSSKGFFSTDYTQIEYLYFSDNGQYAASVIQKVRDVGTTVVDQTDFIGFNSGLTPPFQLMIILSESLPYYVHACILFHRSEK